MRQRLNVTIGKQYGRLTVMADAGIVNGRHRVDCLCSCGERKTIQLGHVVCGAITSCGCFQRERARDANRTHGRSKTPESFIWQHIRQRCENRKDSGYKNYGGRGIFMCNRWRKSFADFLADMGPRPSQKHTIERCDNNGPYAPDNCYWATRIQQNRNRRNNRLLEYDGRVQLLMEWAEECKINVSTLHKRLRRGWTVKHAITTPVRRK